ncbi:COG1470 family protein [Methanosarcina sp. T3]|uniref:COG1470 family protein n=1 Tax=Methanosarcina sp. T3 TaxID=3439062 RepID=UPI003F853D1B
MSKSTLLRAMSLLSGILLCLALIQAAFAQIEGEGVSGPLSNKTVLHDINPGYQDLYLQQGESSSFNVSFRNNDKKALEVEPKLITVPYSYFDDFDESWITISPASITVDPDEEQEFTVEVNVPEDADGGTYETYIAFTDDITPDSGEDFYAEYINVMYLSVTVPIYQKLELQTYYISDSVEAGEEYVYTIKIKNVAAREITIDPELSRYRYEYSFDEFGLDDDAIEVSAPSVLIPGEIADMVIRIPVPENAAGTYNGFIKMNVDGGEDDGSDPQIDLYLTVRQQPTVPYVKTFNIRTSDPITIEISTYTYSSEAWLRSSPKDEEPSFELSLKYDSSPVDMRLVKTTRRDNVNIGGYDFPVWSTEDRSIYQNHNKYYVETYTIPGAIGEWELSILPKNADNFEYSITIGDSE